MELIRSFFAFPVDERPRREVASFTRKQLSRAVPGVSLRWIPPPNYHVTAVFLGDVPLAAGDELHALALDVCARLAPTSLPLDSASWFPRRHQPRLLALESSAGERLLAAHEILRDALLGAGYRVERRPWRAHLSLARIRRQPGAELLREPLPAPDIELDVRELVLYHSRPAGDGSSYSPVFRLPLSR